MKNVSSLNEIEFRPFTKSDWDGFAWATSFAPQVPPMIGECLVTDGDTPVEVMVILDAVCAEIYVGGDDGMPVLSFNRLGEGSLEWPTVSQLMAYAKQEIPEKRLPKGWAHTGPYFR